jgi:hypothetical protein
VQSLPQFTRQVHYFNTAVYAPQSHSLILRGGEKNPIFYRELQTLSKINQGQTEILTKVLKLMFCGMCNEAGWAEKHRRNAQQQCKHEKRKLIYVKRNYGSFLAFCTAQ